MDGALFFFFALWAFLGGGKREGGGTPAPAPRQLPSGNAGLPINTPEWPQVVPSGLPTFPGSGWEFDEPPPLAVQQRAGQLLSKLWARGSGAWVIEQTAGRWIAYQAQIVASGKKGVVAFRVREASAPSAVPQRATRPRPAPPQTPVRPTATSAPVAPAPPRSLKELRYGMGLKPAAPDPDVVLLQQKLGIEADGRFGSGTRLAVIRFQRAQGLAPNESDDALLKRGFGVVKAATWAALLAVRA